MLYLDELSLSRGIFCAFRKGENFVKHLFLQYFIIMIILLTRESMCFSFFFKLSQSCMPLLKLLIVARA